MDNSVVHASCYEHLAHLDDLWLANIYIMQFWFALDVPADSTCRGVISVVQQKTASCT